MVFYFRIRSLTNPKKTQFPELLADGVRRIWALRGYLVQVIRAPAGYIIARSDGVGWIWTLRGYLVQSIHSPAGHIFGSGIDAMPNVENFTRRSVQFQQSFQVVVVTSGSGATVALRPSNKRSTVVPISLAHNSQSIIPPSLPSVH